MFLKNTSERVTVILNTVRGKITIRPQEIVDIKYKILPPVSKSLAQVTEEEYITFFEKGKDTMEVLVEMEKQGIISTPRVVEEDSFDTLEKIEDEVIDIQDNSVMDMVNSLINQEPIETSEALIVAETDSKSEADNLTQQIDDLRKAWSSTKSVKKKEKLSKEIKELQKQLNKIK